MRLKVEPMAPEDDNPPEASRSDRLEALARAYKANPVNQSAEPVLAALAPFLSHQARRWSILSQHQSGQRIEQEDAEQEVRLIVLKALSTWKPDRALFWTWCFHCVVNALRELLRQARRAPRLVDCQGELPEVASPAGIDSLEHEPLMRALARLPEREQRAVRLFYFDGLTQAQIGEALGVSNERARQIRNQGLAKLRCLLGEDYLNAGNV